MRAVLIALILPVTALAECPAGPDISASETALHSDLLDAPDQIVAKTIADDLWKLWLQAPDTKAQRLLDRAMDRRLAWDLDAAEALLDQLVDYCPDYVEGFNQRAFVRFLREDYEGSLRDIDLVLKRKPAHFGALSGKAITLMNQGRFASGQRALRDALRVHPWLNERGMLVDNGEQDI